MAGSIQTDMDGTYGAELSGTIPSQWGEDVNVTLDAKAFWSQDNTAVTRIYTVGPLQFVPSISDSEWTINWGAGAQKYLTCVRTTGSVSYYAYFFVNLPNGATVTAFRVFRGGGGFTGTGDITLQRKPHSPLGGNPDIMAAVSGWPVTIANEQEDTSIDDAVINNNTYWYFIEADQYYTSTGTTYLHNCQIDYTVVRPQP